MQIESLDTKEEEYGKMLRRILILEDGSFPATSARGWKIGGEKRRVTREEEEFEVGGFMALKEVVEHCQKKNAGRQRSRAQDLLREYQASHARRKLSPQLAEGGCGS